MKKLPYLLMLLLILSGCSSLSTPEIKGVVVDAETGKPIADARILADWRLTTSGPGGPGPGAVKKEIKLITGLDGRFVIPAHRLINYYPYPFGQGGQFGFAIIALGYKIRGFDAYRNGVFESGKFKDITIGKENFIKLTSIDNPKDWMENSSRIYVIMENNEFQLQQNKMFVEKFGNGRWDRKVQLELFETYMSLKDYRNAKRKAREIIEDFPKETQYLVDTMKKLHVDIKEGE